MAEDSNHEVSTESHVAEIKEVAPVNPSSPSEVEKERLEKVQIHDQVAEEARLRDVREQMLHEDPGEESKGSEHGEPATEDEQPDVAAFLEKYPAEVIDAEVQKARVMTQAFERGQQMLHHVREPDVAAGIAAGLIGIASMVTHNPVLAEISMVGGFASAFASRGEDTAGKLKGAVIGAGLAIGGSEGIRHLPIDEATGKVIAGSFDEAMLAIRAVLGGLSFISKFKK